MTAPVLFQFMPPLLPSEYAALTESIKTHGVQVPVLVDEHGAIIDGHHRDQIASELRVDCPREVRAGLTDAEKRSLAISLNKDRRHLTRSQIQALVEESIKVDPYLTNREHARRVGVSDKTVRTTRDRLIANAEIPHSVPRLMPNGKTAPGPKPRIDVIDPATGEVLNGKPKEKPPTDSRLAIPQPARRGGNRPKHRQIIANAVIAGQGLSIVLDEISTLDGSLDAAEAGRLASDLSTVIRSLKRIQSLLTKEV